jgi:hypothetical protein
MFRIRWFAPCEFAENKRTPAQLNANHLAQSTSRAVMLGLLQNAPGTTCSLWSGGSASEILEMRAHHGRPRLSTKRGSREEHVPASERRTFLRVADKLDGSSVPTRRDHQERHRMMDTQLTGMARRNIPSRTAQRLYQIRPHEGGACSSTSPIAGLPPLFKVPTRSSAPIPAH